MWPVVFRCGGRIWKFLLTHPVWDVTKVQGITGTNSKFLLTHPVWDVTCVPNFGTFLMRISTHTSRVGCDPLATAALKLLLHFYSHIPCGMWPFQPPQYIKDIIISTHTSRVGCDISPPFMNDYTAKISTHTSRVGCDVRLCRTLWSEWNFYSHIPCGMWRMMINHSQRPSKFLLTHPVWDVTQENCNKY